MAGKTKNPDYGNESITSLKGAERVRLRPGVIFGSDGLEGCEHSVFEILSNSIDEAKEGHGDKIIVTKYLDKSIEIEDFGRGCPVDFNKAENKFNWELIYCELYAGGKYSKEASDNYQFSLGLNGLGSCATQYASEYMRVTVYRDGKKYSLSFEKGENTGGLESEDYKGKRTGTLTHWKPDIDVFTDINIPLEYYSDILKKQAVVNPKVRFILRNETTAGFEEEEFYYENGIVDYIKELSDDNLCDVKLWQADRKGRDRTDKAEYLVRMNIAFAFSNKFNILEYYHNSSFLEHGGSPDKAVHSAFLYEFDSFLKQNNKYTKNESKINFQDIEDCLILIANTFSTHTSYENQTKKSINNKFIQDTMNEFLRSQLEVYFIENKEEALKIADQILINKRSRENAEKARINIKKTLQGNTNLANKVKKFVDCRSKDLSIREIYIVEGDSALGSCKQGRDPNFQAIIPVRGKILNCLKADYNKIFQSEIITNLIKVLGCGAEIKSKHVKDINSFDIDALKWNKIIICTDADYDGFQIRTLILTMLYILTPKLIDEGFVYIAESPLFEITCKGKSYFAYTEKEKTDILNKLDGKKYNIQRSKGLGENDPDMMWETTMNPETRRLIRIKAEDVIYTAKIFDMLLGDDIDSRKDYIAKYGSDYLEIADIS